MKSLIAAVAALSPGGLAIAQTCLPSPFEPDGYALIGSPNNDAVASNAGRARMYWSDGSYMAESVGAAANHHAGAAVATIWIGGLLNQIIAVGEPDYQIAGSAVGRVLLTDVEFGTTAEVFGNQAGGGFGKAIAFGYIDGNADADLIVGAPNDSQAYAQSGRIWIYFDILATGNTQVDLVLAGSQVNEHFGSAIAADRDVNDDGHGDLIVGAPDFDLQAGGSAINAGRAQIYLGGPGFNGSSSWAIGCYLAGERCGASVALAQRLNNDSYDDAIIGAPSNGAGRAYVYFGGASSLTLAGTLNGAANGDLFGISVTMADYNADHTYDDVIVGAEGNDAGGTNAGRVYVYNGGPGTSFNTTADYILTGSTGAGFGHAVAGFGGGYWSGHHRYALVVGAPNHSFGAGRAYIFWPCETIAHATLLGGAIGDQFGASVAGY